jgi:hypothetical protein
MTDNKVAVDKSSVPVGTADKVSVRAKVQHTIQGPQVPVGICQSSLQRVGQNYCAAGHLVCAFKQPQRAEIQSGFAQIFGEIARRVSLGEFLKLN